MHPRFARRIAEQIQIRKFKLGWRLPQLTRWLVERFPQLTEDDSQQVKTCLAELTNKTK